MTPDALRTLIGGGETLGVEFKGEDRTPLADRDLVEAIVCLVNRIGIAPAYILIGVEGTAASHREAGELCPLSPDQAYRLLTRLKDEGRLARHGSKKGAWYERRA